MNLLSLLLILILNVQFCNGASPVLDTNSLAVVGQPGPSFQLKALEELSPGRSSQGDSGSEHSGSPASTGSFFVSDYPMGAVEEAACNLFAKVALAFYCNKQKVIQQELEQLLILLQEERLARLLFEKICLIELKREQNKLPVYLCVAPMQKVEQKKRYEIEDKEVAEYQLIVRMRDDNKSLLARRKKEENAMKFGIRTWSEFLEKDNDARPCHPCLLNKDSSFLVRFFKLLISA